MAVTITGLNIWSSLTQLKRLGCPLQERRALSSKMALNCRFLNFHLLSVGCLLGFIKLFCFHRQQILELQIQRLVIAKEQDAFNRYIMHAYGSKGVAMVNLSSPEKRWKSSVREILRQIASFQECCHKECFLSNERSCKKMFNIGQGPLKPEMVGIGNVETGTDLV